MSFSHAMTQYHTSPDFQPSGGTEVLDPHYFTLTAPSDKALAVLEAIEKIREQFELGGTSLVWKYSKKQWEERQPQPSDQAAPRKTAASAIDETPNPNVNPVILRRKWEARITKIQPLALSYADVRIDEIAGHAIRTWWRGLANNLYHLPPAFYFVVFVGLTTWAFGSIVCGYYEAMARLDAHDLSGAWPAFWRGTIGAIPALTGIITFLFPPTFCVRYR
ncbi:hypothetical protein T440DRAFT_551680 [Plenodomus tracheiphilus IPT5]|uniref:Uncharacterized protein n=1 Tax=Plenodomus tracheiphilus IPT5 TaxID=1408161 RepID=A0A6A7BJJ9_9PLEO|nr:hypothetical protein T440DRAFT_551680 [Plenodomus tracheiphilus IPT5]